MLVRFSKLMVMGLVVLSSMAFAKKPETEAQVLRKIHLINQTEIAAANLARDRAESQKTRDYANTLVRDHQAADDRVMATATDLKVDVSSAMPDVDEKLNAQQKKLLNKLSAANASEFDKTFAKEMKSAHDDAISDLNDAKQKFPGTQTAKLIDQLLPTLHQHQHEAEGIKKLAE